MQAILSLFIWNQCVHACFQTDLERHKAAVHTLHIWLVHDAQVMQQINRHLSALFGIMKHSKTLPQTISSPFAYIDLEIETQLMHV